MKYRVQLDLSFKSEQDAKALRDHAGKLLPKATNINAGLPNEEKSCIRYHHCYHDEGKPCGSIEKYEK